MFDALNTDAYTRYLTSLMKVSDIECELEHRISTMVICGSYVHEFSVSEDMKNEINHDERRKEVVARKVAAHFYV